MSIIDADTKVGAAVNYYWGKKSLMIANKLSHVYTAAQGKVCVMFHVT